MTGLRVVVLLGLMTLAACSGRDGRLRDLTQSRGAPEEFAIVPNKPLAQPETYTALPAPTPGGNNRTDQTPLADAVAVLGGAPSRLALTGGVPASDSALLGAATRFGLQGNIRGMLAEEDLAFRKRRALFNWRLVRDDEYLRAYRPQRLDAQSELVKFRRAGAMTPSAPPDAN